MVCTTVTVTGAGIPPLLGDKYYDCVNGRCDEKVGGTYKNDPKCAGKCTLVSSTSVPAPADNTTTYILLGAAILGALYFMTGRK